MVLMTVEIISTFKDKTKQRLCCTCPLYIGDILSINSQYLSIDCYVIFSPLFTLYTKIKQKLKLIKGVETRENLYQSII